VIAGDLIALRAGWRARPLTSSASGEHIVGRKTPRVAPLDFSFQSTGANDNCGPYRQKRGSNGAPRITFFKPRLT
jgi:hypothetical protein